MPKITIDGTEVTVNPGTTVIEAALRHGSPVPHYCYHPRLPVAGNCRMCLVEVEKAPKLVTACTTPIDRDGMVVHTKSPRVKEAQAAVLQNFFCSITHSDCPICDKAGECDLQNLYFEYSGRDSRLGVEEKVHKPKNLDIGHHIVLDAERCILCTRCVRFMDDVAHDPVLGVVNRGDHSQLTVFPDKRLDSRYSINTADICPVGALTSKQFRFRKRVWFLSHAKSVCPHCATGCPVVIDHHEGQIYRMMPGERDGVHTWLCDPGRLGYDFVNSSSRPQMPMQVTHDSNGAQLIASWDDALNGAAAAIDRVTRGVKPADFGVIFSNWCTNEEIYALLKLSGQLGLKTIAAHTPLKGLVDSGPADEILVRADKNPNTRGAKEIPGILEGGLKSVADVIEAIEQGKMKGLYILDPDFLGRMDDALRDRARAALKKLDFLKLVQSPLQQRDQSHGARAFSQCNLGGKRRDLHER